MPDSQTNTPDPAPPRLFLRVAHGPDRGKGWELDPDTQYTLGRSRRCLLRLTDLTVSAVHARLSAERGVWYLADRESSHGTRLNNQRILAPRPLFDRDRIRLGNTVLEFREYEFLTDAELAEIDRGVDHIG